MAKKRLGIAAVAMILIVTVFTTVFLNSRNQDYNKTEANPAINQTETVLAAKEEDSEYIRLQEYKQINPDVKAIIHFESGLIEQPVVQSSDNDHYLYTDWQSGEPSELGSIVLDYENDLDSDDMNTILYGHYVYPEYSEDRTLMFTPLDLLKDSEEYEDNRYLELITQNELRRYEIVSVFQCPVELVGDIKYPIMSMQYNLVSYDEIYFQNYMEEIRQHQYYDTGVACEYGDRLLTLQTCVEGDEDSREIVLCREIEREGQE